MVRLAALPAAYAADRGGIELAAPAQTGSDVVRGEIESNGLLSLVTYCSHIDDIAQESPAGSTSSPEFTNVATHPRPELSPAGFRDLTSGRSTRGE